MYVKLAIALIRSHLAENAWLSKKRGGGWECREENERGVNRRGDRNGKGGKEGR